VTTIDWALLGVLVLSMLIGAWRGLVYEVLSVLGWAVSFFAAQWFAPSVAAMLPLQSASEPVRYAVAFVLVFIGVLVVCSLLTVAIKKLVQAVGLRPIDRTLGAGFGILRGLILLLAATVVMNMTSLKTSSWWQESKGAAVLNGALITIKPMLPEQFAKYLI
jgi:membrane protein required for colicin V production